MWCPSNFEPGYKRTYTFFTYFIVLCMLSGCVAASIACVISLLNKEFDFDVFFITTSVLNAFYKALNILITRKSIERLLEKAFEKRWLEPRDEVEEKIIENFEKQSRYVLF